MSDSFSDIQMSNALNVQLPFRAFADSLLSNVPFLFGHSRITCLECLLYHPKMELEGSICLTLSTYVM